MNLIREHIEKNSVDVEWINGENNISDVLTKQGVCSKQILFVLRQGRLNKIK